MKKLILILSLVFSFLSVFAQESVATYPTAYRIFAQTGDNIVTNITSVETSIFGSGVGSRTLLAGFWRVGSSIEVKLKGVSFTGVAPLNTKFNIKLGSTAIISSLAVLPASLAGDGWELDMLITCRTNGATGAIQIDGSYRTISASGILGSLSVLPFKMTTPFVINTLIENPIDITITNSLITTAFHTKSAVILMYP